MDRETLIDKSEKLMYGLIKAARRQSFVEFCEDWGIDYEEEWPEIQAYWEEQLEIKIR